jgi:hypothetical protein
MARRRRKNLSPATERRRKHTIEGIGLLLVVLVAVLLCYLAFSK